MQSSLWVHFAQLALLNSLVVSTGNCQYYEYQGGQPSNQGGETDSSLYPNNDDQVPSSNNGEGSSDQGSQQGSTAGQNGGDNCNCIGAYNGCVIKCSGPPPKPSVCYVQESCESEREKCVQQCSAGALPDKDYTGYGCPNCDEQQRNADKYCTSGGISDPDMGTDCECRHDCRKCIAECSDKPDSQWTPCFKGCVTKFNQCLEACMNPMAGREADYKDMTPDQFRGGRR